MLSYSYLILNKEGFKVAVKEKSTKAGRKET